MFVEMEEATSTEADEMIHCDKEEASVPLISNGVNYSELPQHYVRPPTERPNLDEVVISLDSIPLVDLQRLSHDSTRADVVQQIARACAEYGFFQVISLILL